MALPSCRQYERILQLAAALLDTPEPDEAWYLVGQELLGPLVSGEIAYVLTLDMADITGELAHVRPDRTAQRVAGRIVPGSPLQEMLRNHPLVLHYAGTRALDPLQITDVISASAWRRSITYGQARELFGTGFPLALPLAVEAQTYRIAVVARTKRGFCERERALAVQLQPLLISLDRHLCHLQQWRRTTTGSATASAQLDTAATSAADLGITARELVVLSLLPKALTTEGIAGRLAISPRTVHKHLERLYRKLGAPNRLAAVVGAQQLGLLPATTPVVRPQGMSYSWMYESRVDQLGG
jgi:DNA-binding CsgD family transcriptional regulator